MCLCKNLSCEWAALPRPVLMQLDSRVPKDAQRTTLQVEFEATAQVSSCGDRSGQV